MVEMYDNRGPAGALVHRPRSNARDCSGSCMVDLPSLNGRPNPQVGHHAAISSQPISYGVLCRQLQLVVFNVL